ncbi:MAG: hypothetical protein ACKVT0_02135 [Planctomycetaceae bacterium]
MSQSSNHHESDHNVEATSFTATTENAAGKSNSRLAWFLLAFLCVFFGGGMAIVFALPKHPSDDPWARELLAVFCFILMLMFAVLLRYAPRVTCRIDAVGIDSKSIKGDRKFLAWDDVEAVWWGSNTVSFRGASGTIWTPLHYMERTERDAALLFIESKLKNEFDLRPYRNMRITLMGCLRMFAIAIPCAAYVVGGTLLHIFVMAPYFDEHRLSRSYGAIVVFVPVTLLFFVALWKSSRPPTWRVRHQKYAILDDPST